MPLFDLASLTKPLVTAPLALEHLDLDEDRRRELGFTARPEPLTVRQLLSHAAGLPPWLPWTGESLALRLARGFPAGTHPLLREGRPGCALYSDLGYALLADLLERRLGRSLAELGHEATGLVPAPWAEAPTPLPDGPDLEAWRLAEPGLDLPARAPGLPHDANARAGMRGHAGFGGTPELLEAWVGRWLARFPRRMAVPTATGEEGARWGLGLQQVPDGAYAGLLADLPTEPFGLRIQVDSTCALPDLGSAAPPAEAPEGWWYHTGYTGCALFVRPADASACLLLCHRLGPEGELLDLPTLTRRRCLGLARLVARLGAEGP